MNEFALTLAFTAVGSLIMIVFSPLRPLLEWSADYLGRIALIVLLSIAVGLVRKSTRFSQYLPVLVGLLILVCRGLA